MPVRKHSKKLLHALVVLEELFAIGVYLNMVLEAAPGDTQTEWRRSPA